MGNVVKLFRRRKEREQPEPNVWMCDCGCPHFYYYEHGELQCVECKTMQVLPSGHDLPPPPDAS